MVERFRQHIKENFSELESKTSLIAVSGGIDSIVLLHLCKSIGLQVAVAHCNFHLREGDCDLDQHFVQTVAQDLNMPFYTTDFNTTMYAKEQKMSIQMAARELRYQWFSKILNENQYSYLLTAHHLDDSMETFFINLSRGTGIEGLLGIPERTETIRRPLLIFTRNDIENYAKVNFIEWREDYTNEQTKYLRNKIRKNILPLFKGVNKVVDNSFQNTVTFLKESHQMAEDASRLLYEQIVTKQQGDLLFSLKGLKELSMPKAYLYKWLEPYGFKAWNDIQDLLNAQTGKKILSPTHILIKEREFLCLRSIEEKNNIKEEVYYLHLDQMTEKPVCLQMERFEGKEDEIQWSDTCIYVDSDRIQLPLEIRKPKKGDFFIPFGMKGTKRVSKYLKDEKYSQAEKENIWLLCSGDNIVWIIGSRTDDRFKVRDTTTNIYKINLNL